MAEELEELWKKLTFTEEEDIGIELDSRSTKVAREMGKFFFYNEDPIPMKYKCGCVEEKFENAMET